MREEEREGGRKRGRKKGSEEEREGGKEEGRKGGREERREEGKEGGSNNMVSDLITVECDTLLSVNTHSVQVCVGGR